MKKIDFKKAIQEKTQSIPLSLLETEERIKSQIIVLDEIRDYINPLTNDEFTGLERTLLEEGINDPLIVWETSSTTAGIDNLGTEVYVLIDGHHRYKISKKHNLPFSIVLKKYATLDLVKAAMLDKQLNRRNLTPEQVSYYRGLKYNISKAKQVGVEKQVNIASELSKEFGVNEKTVRRDGIFAKGLDKLSPELKSSVLSGQVSLPKATVSFLSKLDAVDEITSIDEIEHLIKQEAENQPEKIQKTESFTEKVVEIKQQIRELAQTELSREECQKLLTALNELLPLL